MKSILPNRRWLFLTVMLCICFSMRANIIDNEKNTNASEWHPQMFYVLLPDLSLSFRLPYEPDQSGVHNLFFISKETGEMLFSDPVKDSRRDFASFLSSSGSIYDAILLYNSGKYVRYNDIVFENGAEVDMRNQRIQPADSVSEQWKTMKAFDYAISDRTPGNDQISESDFIIKGYVFSENGDVFNKTIESSPWQWKISVRSNGTHAKETTCTNDGYFEIDAEDNTEQELHFSATLHNNTEINIMPNCGFFLVMKVFGKAQKETSPR